MLSHRAPPGDPKGFSIIESMVAMVVIMVGILGLYSGFRVTVQANAKGRKISQATEVASAVAHSLAVAAWDSNALKNSATGNDADVADRARAYEQPGTPSPVADHKLALSGVGASGATDLQTLAAFDSTEKLDFDGNGQPDFEVYWNISNCTVDSTTTPWTVTPGATQANTVLKRIGIIVRWKENEAWNEIAVETNRATSSSMGL